MLPVRGGPGAGGGLVSRLAAIPADFEARGLTADQDARHGVRHEQESSSTPTFTTASRAGCRLKGVPPRLLQDGQGTMTREEYLAWRDPS